MRGSVSGEGVYLAPAESCRDEVTAETTTGGLHIRWDVNVAPAAKPDPVRKPVLHNLIKGNVRRNWIYQDGKWNCINGVFTGEPKQGFATLISRFELDADVYRLELMLRVSQFRDATSNIAVRFGKFEKYWFHMQFNPERDDCWLKTFHPPDRSKEKNYILVPATLDKDKWHKIEIAVNKSDIVMHVDQKQVMKTQVDRTLKPHVSFLLYRLDAKIAKIKVTEMKIQ
ncbi:MAG: hypothetical protein ACYTHN_23930 [Planctomycetota bacterium]